MQPNPNPSPKSRFLQNSGFTATHRELVQRADFERAIDYAILQMTRSEEGNADAVAGFHRLMGAVAFVDILKRLAEVASPKQTRPNDNLDMQK